MAVTQSNEGTVQSTSLPASTGLDNINSAPRMTTMLLEDVGHSISPSSLVKEFRNGTKLGKLSDAVETTPVPVDEVKGKADGM